MTADAVDRPAVGRPAPDRRAMDRSPELRGRLLQIVTVLGAVLLAAAVLLGLTVTDLRDAQDVGQNRLLPAAVDAQRLLAGFVNQETGERGLVITGDVRFLGPYDAATGALPGLVEDLSRHADTVPGVAPALDRVLEAHQQWLDLSAKPEIATVQRGDLAEAQRIVARGDGRRLFDELRSRTDALQLTLNDALSANSARVQTLGTRLSWLLFLALSLLALGVALLYPALQRLVVIPLERLAGAARQAGEDLSVPVVVQGPREVVSTARDVEGMRLRLKEQVEAARQATEALAQRGPAVLALRAALAPHEVHLPGLELASRLDPAEGFLAGDWFDTIELEGGRLGLVLGDVAGHGPGPAVFALRLKHLMAAALATGRSPGEALTFTARQLGDTGEAFATAFVAVIDPSSGWLQYANAGHPAALLLHADDQAEASGHLQAATGQPRIPAPRGRPDGSAALEVSEAGQALDRLELAPTGPLLSSLVAAWSWGTQGHRFGPGDLLLAYTDGLIEARDAAGEQYGVARLAAQVAALEGRPLRMLIAGLLAGVAEHSGGRLSDDSTVVACRRT